EPRCGPRTPAPGSTPSQTLHRLRPPGSSRDPNENACCKPWLSPAATNGTKMFVERIRQRMTRSGRFLAGVSSGWPPGYNTPEATRKELGNRSGRFASGEPDRRPAEDGGPGQV